MINIQHVKYLKLSTSVHHYPGLNVSLKAIKKEYHLGTWYVDLGM